MSSIYKKALGADFQRLHPKLQEKFRLSSDDHRAIICTGTMEEISGGRWFMSPFIKLGIKKNITFPERGTGIPFKLEKYAYKDPYEREMVAWIRTFHFKNADRRFDATMVYSDKTKGIIDYLGNQQASPVGIDFRVSETGGIRMKSTYQFFHLGEKRISVPSRMIGQATVNEEFDEKNNRFSIDVSVKNAVFGTIFRYKGHFQMEVVPMPPGQLPAYAFPQKFDARE
ncbi:DUF4166 domain-containing protein [Pseudalkalibacillus sp. R45]|uniref:DUF4166 domain-containing protein n=1 Tax=Pseudalkalibacillus sp. R45 TaxID=3457433 RepID=UPI003FCEE2F9